MTLSLLITKLRGKPNSNKDMKLLNKEDCASFSNNFIQ